MIVLIDNFDSFTHNLARYFCELGESVEVFRNNDEPIVLEAIETEENSGIFRTEVDTSAEEEEGKLKVAPGDRVNLRYVDPQNTFPGHSFPREGLVFVRKPTDGYVRIVETRFVPTASGGASPTYLSRPDEVPEVSGFAYEMPLTVEVIDPDAAKDSLSKTTVKVVVGEGNASRAVSYTHLTLPTICSV